MARKPAKCNLCQHTTAMRVFDNDGTYFDM
jgi:hypothetical protein